MRYLEDILSSDDLIDIAHSWAKQFLVKTSDEEINQLLEDNFINGFLAGAVVIRNIVYEELNM